MSARASEIPFFIKARTPKELQTLMIKTNIKNHTTIQYFDIQYVEGSWYAWFYLALDTYKVIEDVAAKS